MKNDEDGRSAPATCNMEVPVTCTCGYVMGDDPDCEDHGDKAMKETRQRIRALEEKKGPTCPACLGDGTVSHYDESMTTCVVCFGHGWVREDAGCITGR